MNINRVIWLCGLLIGCGTKADDISLVSHDIDASTAAPDMLETAIPETDAAAGDDSNIDEAFDDVDSGAYSDDDSSGIESDGIDIEPSLDSHVDLSTDSSVGDYDIDGDAPITEVEVHVNTWPDGADVFIDGSPAGMTPLDVTLSFGLYQFRFEKENYFPVSSIYEVTHSTVEIVEILQALPKIQVTFTSGIPQEPEIEVHIDSWTNESFFTPFTFEFEANSNHMIFCEKDGYGDKSFAVNVGEEDFDFEPIVLVPLSYEDYCGWISGEAEFVEGTVPPTPNVNLEVDIYNDHCDVWGLTPPSPAGVALYGEYESQVFQQLRISCPSDQLCKFIQCWAIPDVRILDCTYRDAENVQQSIVWHVIDP
ncbi:MAG: PEGA domain-containing protein [Patescibacteria group bacterium]